MNITYSDLIDDFSMGNITEYDNPTSTRMALARRYGVDGLHVCHELTKCRDNLQWALRTRKRMQEDEFDEWELDGDDYMENCGVLCSTNDEDNYDFSEFSLLIYSDADMHHIVKRLNAYARMAKLPKFELEVLPVDDKYGSSPMYLLTSGGEWNAHMLFSFATFAVRFHAEMPKYVYLSSLRNLPIVSEDDGYSNGRLVSETVEVFVHKIKRHDIKPNWVRLLLARSKELATLEGPYPAFVNAFMNACDRGVHRPSDTRGTRMIQEVIYD